MDVPTFIFNELTAGPQESIFKIVIYMDEAEYCDRLSIMVDGKIEALSSPTQMKKDLHATSMDDVFYQLARKAQRQE